MYYKSCVHSTNTVPMRYADEWHGDGQLYLPSSVKTSDDIFQTYAGPELLEEEERDVKKSLDRLLAARNGVVHELGLATPPRVVVTSKSKSVEGVARHFGLAPDTCLLFDDNSELRNDPHVVLVDPLESLPPERRQDVLAFMQRELPADTLDADLVEYLEGARPEEVSLRRDASGHLAWWVPEAKAQQAAWLTPRLPLQATESSDCRVSRLSLQLEALTDVKGVEFDSELDRLERSFFYVSLESSFSDLSPVDVVQYAAGHAHIDLRATAEKGTKTVRMPERSPSKGVIMRHLDLESVCAVTA